MTYQTEAIAKVMKDSGFETEVMNGRIVKVSLTNRRVNTDEVGLVLEKEFEGINFRLTRDYGSTLITV